MSTQTETVRLMLRGTRFASIITDLTRDMDLKTIVENPKYSLSKEDQKYLLTQKDFKKRH